MFGLLIWYWKEHLQYFLKLDYQSSLIFLFLDKCLKEFRTVMEKKKRLARRGALFVSYKWLHKTGFNEKLSYSRTFVLYVLWPFLHTTYNHEAHYEITYSWLLQYLLMSKIIDFFIAYITMLSSAVISYRRDQAVTTHTCYEEK